MTTKTVSDILRDCAFALPRSEHVTMRAALGGPARTSSPYICDYLEFSVSGNEAGVAHEAKWFLHSLGMGHGISEFDFRDKYGDATRKTQYQRCMWLFFAADLWDEGFRP